MNSGHAYDMLMQNLNAQIAQGKEDRNSKAEDKATALRAKTSDTEGDDLAFSRPEANAYEFQSKGVIEMLEKLLTSSSTRKPALRRRR